MQFINSATELGSLHAESSKISIRLLMAEKTWTLMEKMVDPNLNSYYIIVVQYYHKCRTKLISKLILATLKRGILDSSHYRLVQIDF